MDSQKEDIVKNEEFHDKSTHQNQNDSKPVGYGSSIQSSGHGNKNRPHEQKDIGRKSEQEQLQKETLFSLVIRLQTADSELKTN
jgi:hypothetical protein